MTEAMQYLKQHAQEIARSAEAEAASAAAELAEATGKLESANAALQVEKAAFSNIQVHIHLTRAWLLHGFCSCSFCCKGSSGVHYWGGAW